MLKRVIGAALFLLLSVLVRPVAASADDDHKVKVERHAGG
jgi:hypothetical protein